MITPAINQSHPGRGDPRLRLFIIAFLLASTIWLPAQTNSMELNSSTSTSWNTNPAHWERMIEQRKTSSALRIGKSDFTISGPLVDGLRRKRFTGERSLGKRLLGLPVVRLFVPQPMPSPPGGGRYFCWGERAESWSSISKAPAPLGNTDNPIHHEAVGTLISIGLK
jgi:hypothetical protein